MSYSKRVVYRDVLQVVDYGDFQEYFVLKYKRQDGFEQINKSRDSNYVTDKDLCEEKSIMRSKRTLREIVLANDFEYFFTQTFNSNRTDNDFLSELLQKKFKAYKRKNKDFEYVYIFEKHKDKKSYHIHGLVKSLGDDVYLNKNGFLSLGFFEDIGFNSLKKINGSLDDKKRVANYVLKYIIKDIVKTSKNQRYFCSKYLKRPDKKFFKNYNLNNFNVLYENDFFIKLEKIN